MPWALSNLYWEQNFLDYRHTVLAGLLDATDYTNVYALMDPWADFFNLASDASQDVHAVFGLWGRVNL
jgi:porin